VRHLRLVVAVDSQCGQAISISSSLRGRGYAFRAENRAVTPGDDTEGQEVRWVSVEEIEAGEIDLGVPAEGAWLFRRALAALEARQPTSPP
jgi:hypothetical protein